MSGTFLLDSPEAVVRCLLTFTDWWQPATSSILQVGAARRGGRDGDGLHPGVLDTLDERAELGLRIAQLPEREQAALFCFYVAQLSPKEASNVIGVSPRQCLRLRSRAVRRVVELGQPEPEDAAA